MKNRVKMIVMAMLAMVTLSLVAVVTGDVRAANKWTNDACKAGLDETQKAALGCNENRKAGSVGVDLVNVVIGLIGVAAVVAIILGGIQYVTANGDAGKIATAKNTILYAVIGLVVAILAFAIVNFVVGETGLGA